VCDNVTSGMRRLKLARAVKCQIEEKKSYTRLHYRLLLPEDA
jgi:hypothetical protein